MPAMLFATWRRASRAGPAPTTARHTEKTDQTMASKPKKPATKVAKTAAKPVTAPPVLADVRAHIDGIDRQIQALIADARRLCAAGRQGQGQARRRGRLLPARARSAGAAHGGGPQRRPAQRRSAGACVPRDHVRLPGPAGTAEDRLPRPGRHLQPAGGAQALRPLRARPAAGQHRGSVPGSGSAATPISAWCRWRTRGRARSRSPWTCS